MPELRADDPATTSRPESARSLSDHIEQNVESIVALERREVESITPSQRRVEHASRLLGRPMYLLGVLVFALVWVAANLAAAGLGRTAFDPPPFGLLDGILTLASLATTTIVLIAQNRQTKAEKQQAQLDLQVSMLTEQKVTKLIHLLEELRKDLPGVRDRHDPQAAALQESADAATVVSVIEDRAPSAKEPPPPKK
ncbi:MAG TPA: DUF1003 domain-containing protein [Steroidobacteraceae bacterium]|nr:DUF1003 domain-containing protein [Steroidobacteraceae bacterium]